MAKKPTQQGPQTQGSNVVTLERCKAQGCNKQSQLMSFCQEHYDWFKWGLITKEGARPSDFDKKHRSYMAMKKKAA